jgi:hypothetical protein
MISLSRDNRQKIPHHGHRSLGLDRGQKTRTVIDCSVRRSRRTAARITPAAICLSSSTHFALVAYSNMRKPVYSRAARNIIVPGADRLGHEPCVLHLGLLYALGSFFDTTLGKQNELPCTRNRAPVLRHCIGRLDFRIDALPKGLAFIAAAAANGGATQAGQTCLYRGNQWFLAEVKSWCDKLSENQKRWIKDNRRYLHLPFKLVKVHRIQTISH